MIGLSRRTYYPRPRAAADAAVDPDAALRHAITDVRRAFPGHGYRRRVTHELRRRDQPVNHKRVRRAMRAMLLPPAPLRRPWLVAEPDAVTGTWYPNLRAGMVPTACSELWVAEITYVRLERAFVFLAVVLDVFSRKIVGYAIGPTLDARLSLAALDAAMTYRGVNAHAESFMKTLKHEEIYPRGYRTMADVIAHLPHFLETIYNNDRLHSALGYRTPNEYEADHVLTLSSGQIAAS
jgi:putative transposase